MVRYSYRHVRNTINNFGLQMLLVQHWNRLDVPTLLRVFWVSRFSLHLMFLTFNNLFHQKFGPNGQLNSSNQTLTQLSSFSDNRDSTLPESFSGCFIFCVEYLLARSTETLVSLFGMTSMLSTFGQSIGAMFHLFLRVNSQIELVSFIFIRVFSLRITMMRKEMPEVSRVFFFWSWHCKRV